ncbi:HAT C-terminal dimerization domain [Arabidopsis thaliana x Arabidopsis arenosa]|uniref:HAT C-terminal dimerization domain n=1 Tax=Arabidopsis thaliana x Arabidopsis arenosa TaxID=1240361 RepID=A0A8T2BIT7_9BRAS|nr:HAT C-terminal dimerization domain [Arabidopsis thaliana x Arabidopsis arenosa]
MGSSSLPEEDVDLDTNAETQDTEDDSRIPENRKKRKESKEASGKSSKGKGKAKSKEERERSYVWEHFTRLKDNINKCSCHYCGKTLACPTTSGTSNLQKHLTFACKQFKVWQDSEMQKILNPDGSHLMAGKVSIEVVREATNEMLVLGQMPLSFIESIAWRHFTTKCNLYKPVSRRTATRDIYEMFVKRKEEMRKWMRATKQRVSLTTDIWTAHVTGASYMVITCHFVDANWHLRKLIIGFKYVADHKGATIAAVLSSCLDEWGIEKIFTITVDNATANTSALQKFERAFRAKNGNNAFILDAEMMHMRCSAHIINLIVKDGLHEINSHVEAVRNAVTFVRSSTKRLISFDQRVDASNLSRGSLPLDVETRWNSTYLMLKKAQKFREAFDRMEAEDKIYNNYFLEMEKGKKRVGPPTYLDWVEIERMVKFLNFFYTATLIVSASTSVNSYKCYGEIVTIEKNMILLSQSNDPEMRTRAKDMKEKFDKYWEGFKNINKLLIVATVFDPTKKMQFAQLCFDKVYGKDSVDSKEMYDSTYSVLTSLFKEYSSMFPKVSTDASSSNTVGSNSASASHEQATGYAEEELENTDASLGGGFERMQCVYDEMVDELGVHDAQDELDMYLKEKAEHPKSNMFGDEYDVMDWWRRNSGKFPILSEIARDVFAMQVSSVASESAFSTSGRMLEPSRSCLSHYTIEVLMCTDQWMKSEMKLKEQAAMTLSYIYADFVTQDELEKEFGALGVNE